jgi:hypothetical protein
MRWLSSRLAHGSPRRRRARIGSGSELEVGVLVEERNFTELAGEFARDLWREPLPGVPAVGVLDRQPTKGSTRSRWMWPRRAR